MKKIAMLMVIVLALTITSVAHAQYNSDTWLKNRISANPLGLLLGIGSIDYERALAENFSLTISPSFIYFGWGGDDNIYGGGLGLGANYYISGKAPQGLHLTVDATPTYITTSNDTNSILLCSRALFGYNWIWNSQFTLGLGGGIQYVYLNSNNVDSAIKGVLPAVSLTLGFAF